MDEQKKAFIDTNRGRLGTRQLARRTGLTRSEIEAYLKGQGESIPAALAAKPGAVTREWAYLAGLFALALAVRAAYILWLSGSHFFGPLSPGLDDGVYLQMAESISKGNWAGVFPLGAYRIPLYPYFLASLFVVFGKSLAVVHWTQSALIGSLSALLAYGLARNVFSDTRAARIAGLLTAVYFPFIFFENLLLGESISIFFNLLALWLASGPCGGRADGWRRFFLPGFFLGISSLLRPNTLLAALFVGGYLLWPRRRAGRGVGVGDSAWESRVSLKRGPLAAVLFFFGIALAVLPMMARNYRLYGDLSPVSAIGGINFYIGNHAQATGKFALVPEVGTSLDEMIRKSQAIAEKEAGRSLRPSEVSAFWLGKGLRSIGADPAKAALLFLRKTAYFFNGYEFPDILDMAFVAEFNRWLKPLCNLYGLLLIFGLHGMYLCWRSRAEKPGLLLIFFGGYYLSVAFFFVTARYRLPAVSCLVIFAAASLAELGRALRSPGKEGVLPFAVIAGLASLVAVVPVERTTFGTNYNSLGIFLKKSGRFAEAEECYRKAIEIEPRYPSPYYNMALLMRATGRGEEAAAYDARYERAKRGLGAS